MILQTFFTKMAITSPRKVQIPKFWCLKSSTGNWPSFGNINSIQKVKKNWTRAKGRFKTCQNRPNFCIEKIKFAFSQIFSKVWFDIFFLWLPMYQTNNNSLTKFIIQDRCGGRDVRVAWSNYITYYIVTLSTLLSNLTHDKVFWFRLYDSQRYLLEI